MFFVYPKPWKHQTRNKKQTVMISIRKYKRITKRLSQRCVELQNHHIPQKGSPLNSTSFMVTKQNPQQTTDWRLINKFYGCFDLRIVFQSTYRIKSLFSLVFQRNLTSFISIKGRYQGEPSNCTAVFWAFNVLWRGDTHIQWNLDITKGQKIGTDKICSL